MAEKKNRVLTAEQKLAHAEYKRRWGRENAERVKEVRAKWRAKNPDKTREYRKRYNERHLGANSRSAERYKRENPDWFQKWKEDYRPTKSELGRARYRLRRAQALEVYGGRCACCGESNPCFLTIDHINNDGAGHRKQRASTGHGMITWLSRNDFPQGQFQILCYNCNCAKQHDPAGHRLAHPNAINIDGGQPIENLRVKGPMGLQKA